MAKNVAVASEKELKFLEIIKEKNERIEQLEKALKAKEILNVSLQLAFSKKEKVNKFLKEKLRQSGVSAERFEAEPMQMETDAEKSKENEQKTVQGEKEEAQVEQPENTVDSDFEPEALAVEAAVKVGTIPQILTKLLISMSTRDLVQNCRLVNREWRDFSTAVLLRRKTFQIELRRSSYDSEFFRDPPSPSSKLEKLTTFLSASTTFPCAHFIFNGNLQSADAQAFLTQFGSRVKGLKLIGPQNLNCIRNLLVEQIPHLESLELTKFTVEAPGPIPGPVQNQAAVPVPPPAPAPQILTRIFPEDSQGPAPPLPFLTTLKLGEDNSASLIQEIMDAAPNLQECFKVSSTQDIESLASRIHIVKGFKLKSVHGLYIILKWNSLMPILQQLHLTCFELNLSSASYVRPPPDQRAFFCSTISKILTLSQGSLKTFKFAPAPDYFDCSVQWPQLEKVEELTLSGDLTRDFPRLFLPVENDTGVGVSKIFPNLHTIHLKKIPEIKAGHTSIFKQHPQISTVKCLKISQPKAQNLELFLPLFPNVKHISLAQVKIFADFAPIIWQKKGLKSLEIEFICPGPEIDAGFTGMENSTCRFLRTFGRDEFEVEQVDHFRVRPSILEAKELEQLFLPRGFSEREEYNENRVFIGEDFSKATSVSFKYAFNLMPKLCIFSHAANWN